MPTKPPHPFSADRPVSKLSDDVLGRADFARSIAKAIVNWKGDESLVIALYGGWGDGKSSVKGMVVDTILTMANPRPYMVEFNPWEWSGQNQLSHVFFDEIGKQIALGHHESEVDKHAAEECGLRLRKLGKYLNLTGSIVTPVMYAASLAFPVAAILTPVVAKVFSKSGQLAEQAAEAVQEQAEREDTNLLTVKSNLKVALTALNRNVVVLVDDIDRLAADEIKLLFQLIKANSDFPNLIFFLFFQRDTVERALERTMRTSTGNDYLEKIVQVPLQLPRIQRPMLDAVVMNKMNDVITRYSLGQKFSADRWRKWYANCFSSYFENLRDVHRFFATYEFHLALLGGEHPEVNPVDLFGLEVLRVFVPQAHKVIAESKEMLFGSTTTLNLEDFQSNDEKRMANMRADMLSKLPRDLHIRVLGAAECLVPSSETDDSSKWVRDMRLCCSDYFDRYFQLGVATDDLSESEFQQLLVLLDKRDALALKLRALHKRRLAGHALVRLSHYIDVFKAEQADLIIGALFDVGDELLVGFDSRKTDYSFDNVAKLLYQACLDLQISPASRFQALRSAITSTTGIYLPVRSIFFEEYASARKSARDPQFVKFCTLNDDWLNELKQICVTKIKGAADSGLLSGHPELKTLLQRWYRWGQEADVKTYAAGLIDTCPLILVEQFFSGIGEEIPDVVFMEKAGPCFDELLKFVDLRKLYAKLKNLNSSNLTSRQAQVRGFFLINLPEYLEQKGTLSIDDDPSPPSANRTPL